MPQDSRSQNAIIPEGQQELSVSTTLNEFLESYRTPFPLLPSSLSSSPFLQYAFNVSHATGNLQYARESEIKEKVFTLKKFTCQGGDKTNHCATMHQMSQSCLVKWQATTIRLQWEGEIILWSPIQMGTWIHSLHSDRRSKSLKVITCFYVFSLQRETVLFWNDPTASSILLVHPSKCVFRSLIYIL